MSQLTQEALATHEAVKQALDRLQGKMRKYCPPELLTDLVFDFNDVKTPLAALKGLVTAALVCAETPEPAAPKRATSPVPVVPAFPTHAVKPPPKHFHEGVNA